MLTVLQIRAQAKALLAAELARQKAAAKVAPVPVLPSVTTASTVSAAAITSPTLALAEVKRQHKLGKAYLTLAVLYRLQADHASVDSRNSYVLLYRAAASLAGVRF